MSPSTGIGLSGVIALSTYLERVKLDIGARVRTLSSDSINGMAAAAKWSNPNVISNRDLQPVNAPVRGNQELRPVVCELWLIDCLKAICVVVLGGD